MTDAVNWAVEHLSERQAVFSHADLLAGGALAGAGLGHGAGGGVCDRGAGAGWEASRGHRPGARQALGHGGGGGAGMGDRRD